MTRSNNAAFGVLAVCCALTQNVLAQTDLGLQTLAAGDGWASEGAGVSGGADALPAQVYEVRSRSELVAALNNGVFPAGTVPSNEPKIIYVSGVIDANVDDSNRPLGCLDYQRDGYTLLGYLTAYDPATWGRVLPTGAMETARIASQQAQQARVRIRIGSNTTLVGRGKNATLRGAWLDIRGTAGQVGSRSNIIVRNLNFEDAYDCFPQWTPTDGATGNWNAQYDAVSLRDADHVWIDHNTFRDRYTADLFLPSFFGRLWQIHDGLLDITNASDLVTVSWNRFVEHDKTSLVGSSDNAPADVGKLRISFHHNLYEQVGQRAPRVRYGQVHVYNNYFRVGYTPLYQYSLGVGIQSQVVLENNAFDAYFPYRAEQMLGRFNGAAVVTRGNLFNGVPTDLRAAYNQANDPDLGADIAFVPTLTLGLEPAAGVAARVLAGSGPMAW